MILSDWQIYWVWFWEYPKADLKTTSQVSWEDCLVVPLVSCLTKVSQRQGARWDTVHLRRYFSVCYLSTLACFATSLVTEMVMAGKAARLKWVSRVGEQPPTASRGVSRGLQQGRLTLAEKLD